MHLTCITTQEMRFCKIVCLFYMRYLEKILMSKDIYYNGDVILLFYATIKLNKTNKKNYSWIIQFYVKGTGRFEKLFRVTWINFLKEVKAWFSID